MIWLNLSEIILPSTSPSPPSKEYFNLTFLVGPCVPGVASQAGTNFRAPREVFSHADEVAGQTMPEVEPFTHPDRVDATEEDSEVVTWVTRSALPHPVSQVNIIPSSMVQLTGRVALSLHNWELLFQDTWVLETVQGFKLEFFSSPRQDRTPRPIVFSQAVQNFIDLEIQALLEKKAICPSRSESVV